MYMQILLCLLKTDKAFIIKTVKQICQNGKKRRKNAVNAPLHLFMISNSSYSSSTLTVYVPEE